MMPRKASRGTHTGRACVLTRAGVLRQSRGMFKLLQITGVGILGYLVPRVLVGVGVPLDEWGINFGAWLGLSRPWLEEWGLTIIGIIIAVIFAGIEAWWQLARHTFKWILRIFHLSKEKPRNKNRFPLAKLEDWQGTDPLLLWQAGCLWKNIKPRHPVEFDNPAYAAFSMLLRAAEYGELQLIKQEDDFAFSQVTRDELARYAVKKKDVPKFLKDVAQNITEDFVVIDVQESSTHTSEETVRIRKDILWLKENMTDYTPYDQIELETRERLSNVDNSDDLVWVDDITNRLRKDFINAVHRIVSCQKIFESAAEDNEMRQRIRDTWRALEHDSV